MPFVTNTHFPDDETLSDSSAPKELGEIKIDIYRVSNIQTKQTVSCKFPVEQGKVHERSKKAMAHHVKCVGPVSALKVVSFSL